MLRHIITEATSGFLDILTPQLCSQTGLPADSSISDEAVACRPRFGAPACPVCQGPVEGPLARCDVCQDSPIEHVIAAAPYAGWWKEVIRQMKFQPQPAFAVPLAKILVRLIEEEGVLSDGSADEALLVPIPPTSRESIIRGGNMTSAISRMISQRTGLLHAESIYRHRPGTTQRRRSRHERHALKASIYGARALPSTTRLVILVDDVMTTGATLKAAARALKADNSSLHVVAAVLGRAGAPLA